jgi:hypothetical protein
MCIRCAGRVKHHLTPKVTKTALSRQSNGRSKKRNAFNELLRKNETDSTVVITRIEKEEFFREKKFIKAERHFYYRTRLVERSEANMKKPFLLHRRELVEL